MSFLEELKRRRVTRVALLYAAAGYAVAEVAGVLAPALLLPDWTVRLVVLLLLLGAPIALGLAWMFDVTPGTVQADTDGERSGRNAAFTPASIVGAVALVGVGLAVGFLLGAEEGSSPAEDDMASAVLAQPSLASIAVLPFDDMSPEGDQQYFADGMAEELLNALQRVPGLAVAARTSSFAYRGRAEDTRVIADSLGVGTILEGSVRTDGQAIRITAQLINAEDGFHLWSGNFDGQLTGIFALQEEIARAIVEELRVPLGLDASTQLVTHRTDDFDAYQAYIEARELFRVRDLEPAVVALEEAVSRDASFAPAWALLAEIYPIQNNGRPLDELGTSLNMIQRAQAAAQTALDLDSTYAEAHAAMGTVSRERLDWEGAERHLRRAIELDPTYSEAHSNLGEVLSALGRPEEALPHHLRAVELEPRAVVYRFNMTWLAYVPRFNEETLEHGVAAIALLNEAIDAGAVPTRLMGWVWSDHAFNYAALGRFDEARSVIRESRALTDVHRRALELILSDLEVDRQTSDGVAALESIESEFMALPSIWVLYGDLERGARAALGIAWDRPYMWAGFLTGVPELRGYPDFEEARRRRGLPN